MEGKKEEDKREIDRRLDLLEQRINELRISYEQHFSGILPQPPDKEHDDLKRFIRQLYTSPFKNAANRFRLNSLTHRFQTYQTYWERVNKQREAGTYKRDVFKANLQTKEAKARKREQSELGMAEKGIEQLFKTYEKALKQNGGNTKDLDYKAFKKSLIKKANSVKEHTGASSLKYQVVVAGGKVKLRTVPKD